ncbi:MAG: retropepsin-like domain-containing protein [Gammaproteobacteria bacterium]|nr:retropepsin-like domain-containing protein [Gammaproteobacteria bacterium]
MPVLNVQFAGQGRNPNGQNVQIPPSIALAGRGPCVQVQVGVAQLIAQQLLQQGKVVPQPAPGLALIDTGASTTCIDDAVAQALGLPVTNVVQVASASHASTPQNVHPAQIEFIGLPLAIAAPNAIVAPLAAQGLIALIGRDVLQHCTLFYNGPAGSISLAV